jgi:hypothetical protein
MGERGPIRDPGSRRGARELPGFQQDAPELPEPPRWLTIAARATFSGLVEDLAAASVPIRMVDGHAIAMAAHALTQAQSWARRESRVRKIEQKLECSRMAARFQRDAEKLLNVICATPSSRARIGLRATEPKKNAGRVLQIIAARENRP